MLNIGQNKFSRRTRILLEDKEPFTFHEYSNRVDAYNLLLSKSMIIEFYRNYLAQLGYEVKWTPEAP